MALPYIPPTDAGFANWLQNFSSLINASPATYGLTPTDATAIVAVNSAYQAAYTTAVNPATRTKPTVADKDAAKANALSVARPYAIQIRNNDGISNMLKLDLGLTVPDLTPTPVPVPTTFPVLSINNATPLQHLLAYHDSDAPNPKIKKKAAGAIGIQIFRAIGASEAVDPDQCAYLETVTRSPFISEFASADRGKIATYFGRYVTRGRAIGGSSAQVGPWSVAVAMHIV